MFFKGSRYEQVPRSLYIDANGRECCYKTIRFIKETPQEFEHLTTQQERLDLISYKYYKDPTKFWLICDANNVMHPGELEAEGKRIIIPEDTF